MTLTDEQKRIIQSTGDIRILAAAGAGKTSTIIAYAKSRPQTSKILYLAFNKLVKEEAARRFKEHNLPNVIVETAHSLAYKYVISGNGYEIRNSEYSIGEIISLTGVAITTDKELKQILAVHIQACFTAFCNSAAHDLLQFNYMEYLKDPSAGELVLRYKKFIIENCKLLYDKMNKGDIPVTHDFYLKKFQLMKPSLGFEYILFDEAQDGTPAMLDVVRNQRATRVLVGDTHQQIYSWRQAVNSLDAEDYPAYMLTASFRFPQSIASLANEVLRWKNHTGQKTDFNIRGLGCMKPNGMKAVLARTNLGLVIRAMEMMQNDEFGGEIYFEGNVGSYFFNEDGTSLFDVLNLYLNKRNLVKNPEIKAMKSFGVLEDCARNAGNIQMLMLTGIVKKYGSAIPGLLQKLKGLQADDPEKRNAAVIFSTVHRSKGMEYEEVELVNDFISEQKILRHVHELPQNSFSLNKLDEEINLLYVAITRAQMRLKIPAVLFPDNYSPGKEITFLHNEENPEQVYDAVNEIIQPVTAQPGRPKKPFQKKPGTFVNWSARGR